MAPLLAFVWKRPDPARFACCVALASLNSFMLGYHVHEKAILLAILPLTLVAAQSLQCARVFTRLSTIGHFSLLPLIFTPNEYPLKIMIFSMQNLAGHPPPAGRCLQERQH
ncbi:hypothetical protein CVIRNUC_007268 [Coccomyxa viridis]|uniref:Alpha-1,3-glucosyltransferase n=1 Tax=Coccomyxa viridis TaxID=1274662 RepID=A0AAV1ICS8_9CHLO|nr:hypothetical protein CVIRNUC_007268 [Coccomyxa viridis]